MLRDPDRPGRHAERVPGLFRGQAGQHPEHEKLTLVRGQPGEQRPGALRLDVGHDGLLRARAVVRPVGQILRRDGQARRASHCVRHFVRRYAEYERRERPAHVLVPRQRGKNCNAHFLRHIVRNVIMAGKPAEPGPAVPDHHGPYLLEQRLDRSGLAAHSERGQIAKTSLVTPVYLRFHPSPSARCRSAIPGPTKHDAQENAFGHPRKRQQKGHIDVSRRYSGSIYLRSVIEQLLSVIKAFVAAGLTRKCTRATADDSPAAAEPANFRIDARARLAA